MKSISDTNFSSCVKKILSVFVLGISILIFSSSIFELRAQDKNWLQIYGFVMTDAGYNFDQIKPTWYDAMRPSRLPAFKNQYGTDGNTFISVRQTRFGVKTSTQTEMGELTTVFDFDMWGVGADEGQLTIRPRHYYAELGHFGAGQTESAFMDLDVFPNTFEYWGPNGMGFLRLPQVRWIPIKGNTHLVIALEMPGVSADLGVYSDRIELADVNPHLPLPDLGVHYRQAMDWGYVQLGGMLRNIQWEDQSPDSIDLSGKVVGWGVSLSSGINFSENVLLHLQGIYGEGVENYFNDAPVDIGIKNNFSDSKKPIKGVALPDLGIVAFLDVTWNSKFTSSFGYSMVDITNSDGQAPDAYSKGQYAVANLGYHPVPDVLVGVELQWIDRDNYSDGFNSSATKIDFSFKYNFSHKILF